jgi:shikimate dehydrogenase
MLLHQAALGFEGWFGQKPEVTDELRTYVLTKIAERSG